MLSAYALGINSGSYSLFCKKEKPAGFSFLFFHEKGRKGKLLQLRGKVYRTAKASLNEKDFPRPGEDVTQVTKRGAVASRSDDGRSYFVFLKNSSTSSGAAAQLP